MAYILQLLGGFRLTREDGGAISLPDRSQALLAYLAVASSPVPRQVLAELLNTKGGEQELRTTLRQTVYLTRKAMADNAVICTQDDGLVLNGTLVKTDVHLFQSATARRDSRGLQLAETPPCA